MAPLKKIFFLMAATATAMSFAGCGKGYMDMPPMQFRSLVTSNKKVRLIDVRTPEEYLSEHIEGALNIPVADTVAFWASVDSLARKTPFAVYCRTGVRSEKAARMLARKGYTVYHLKGGLEVWLADRLPLAGTSGGNGAGEEGRKSEADYKNAGDVAGKNKDK